jgi:hypothetical protein
MKISNERGAVSLSDFFLAGISALFVGALAVPFMLAQQSDMNKKAAQIDARAIATEVELFLQSNRDLDFGSPITISHNLATQELIIAAAELTVEEQSIKLPISRGSVLPAQSGGGLEKANTLTSETEYCVVVDSFGQRAFHNQNGPADRCGE